MQEEWKQISGYHYSVSNFGSIRNDKTNKILKPMKSNKDTYEEVDLINSISDIKRVKVHRLVAELFVDNPKNLCEVNHKDGNKHNNKADNLEWCTRSYNIKHAYHFNLRSACCENNANSKLSLEDVKYIRANYIPGVNQHNKGNSTELMCKFGITRVQLLNIVKYKQWRNV